MPIKSLQLCLPQEYVDLAKNQLIGFFPDDFEVDLNGRSLPWEAAILIPFANEDKFISLEQELFESKLKLSEEETFRNTVTLKYWAF